MSAGVEFLPPHWPQSPSSDLLTADSGSRRDQANPSAPPAEAAFLGIVYEQLEVDGKKQHIKIYSPKSVSFSGEWCGCLTCVQVLGYEQNV